MNLLCSNFSYSFIFSYIYTSKSLIYINNKDRYESPHSKWNAFLFLFLFISTLICSTSNWKCNIPKILLNNYSTRNFTSFFFWKTRSFTEQLGYFVNPLVKWLHQPKQRTNPLHRRRKRTEYHCTSNGNQCERILHRLSRFFSIEFLGN